MNEKNIEMTDELRNKATSIDDATKAAKETPATGNRNDHSRFCIEQLSALFMANHYARAEKYITKN